MGCRCLDSGPSRIRRLCGLSEFRRLSTVVNDGQRLDKLSETKERRKESRYQSRADVGRRWRSSERDHLAGQDPLVERSSGTPVWPWISVVPAEPTTGISRGEESRRNSQEFHGTKPGGGDLAPDSQFPQIHGDPLVGHFLNFLPVSVFQTISALLSEYGWSAHTVLELRTVMARGARLSPEQAFKILARQKDAVVAYHFLVWLLEEAKCKLHIKCFTVVLHLIGRVQNYSLMERLLGEFHKRGYLMDKIMFTATIRCYAAGQRNQEALDLFLKMKEKGHKPDCVAYSVLIQMFSKAQLYQDALKLYDEMLSQEVATDTQLYNCVVSSLAKAGRLDLAYQKLGEMRERGHIPDHFTYGILLEGYAKAARAEFMDLYREMQSTGVPVNEVIFNIMFSGIERVGTLNDAERVFVDMERVGLSANLNAFSALISMCSMKGEAERAQGWFNKMISIGLHPTLPIGNSLLDSYARAQKLDQAKNVLDSFRHWGITPNLPTLTVCLRCLSICKSAEELKIVQRMLSSHDGSQFLSILLDRSTEKNLAPSIASFLGSLCFERRHHKRDFINVLIDHLYNSRLRRQAYTVWEAALENYVFPAVVQQGPEGICSVNLRGMECGTAIVALTHALLRLAKQFHRKEMTPEWVQIYTTHVIEDAPVQGSKPVHQSVDAILQDLHSPFHPGTLQTGGGFVCRGEEIMHWLDEPEIRAMLSFKH